MSSPARPTPHDRPGGVGKPDPAGTGLLASSQHFLHSVMSTAALRAPVLLMRLRPALRPGRSGPAARARCRRCARHDVAGSRRGRQLLASSQRISRARVPPGDGQQYQLDAPMMQESAPLGTIGSTPRLRLPERFFFRLGTTTPTASQTSRWRPVSSLPMATCPRIEVDGADNTPVGDSWRASSVGQLVCEVSDIPLSDVAGCFQDDAPVRRASRLRTTSGGVHCVYFDTASTSTLCSLTVAGPARTSPRPCGHP